MWNTRYVTHKFKSQCCSNIIWLLEWSLHVVSTTCSWKYTKKTLSLDFFAFQVKNATTTPGLAKLVTTMKCTCERISLIINMNFTFNFTPEPRTVFSVQLNEGSPRVASQRSSSVRELSRDPFSLLLQYPPYPRLSLSGYDSGLRF